MSTLTADPKFARGSVLGIKVHVDDSVNSPFDVMVGDGSGVKGTHSVFLDADPHNLTVHSNLTVECVAVQNKSGKALKAGDLVELDPAKGLGESKTGAATTFYGVVDEYLNFDVKEGEVFWAVVRGPTAAPAPVAAAGAGVTITAGKLATGSGAGALMAASAKADDVTRFILTGSAAQGM